MKKQNVKFKYDFGNDIFVARPLKRKYDSSVQKEDFIFDLDKNGKIVGIEILNASKLFNVPKYFLKEYKKVQVKLQVNEDKIIIKISIQSTIRNSKSNSSINIERIKPEFINPGKLNLAIV